MACSWSEASYSLQRESVLAPCVLAASSCLKRPSRRLRWGTDCTCCAVKSAAKCMMRRFCSCRATVTLSAAAEKRDAHSDVPLRTYRMCL